MPLTDTTFQKLTWYLFERKNHKVYAVLDGASVPKLPHRLWQDQPSNVCLYRGDLEPDLVYTAPYLVDLTADSAFTQWVLQEGWGKHWGIFAITPSDLKTLRKHFRTFLMVFSPEGKPLYFRYYDPRVLRVYLPTCNVEEMRTVFGPIINYVVEAENPEQLVRFSIGRDAPLKEEMEIQNILVKPRLEDDEI